MSTLSRSLLDVGSLVEREQDLAALQAAFERAVAGHGCLAVVTAEAGGGKTSLIEGFCAERPTSTNVLRGTCDALFTARPLGPIHDVALEVGPTLAGLLLAEPTPYQVAAALLEELRRDQVTVLVIEDAHWADEATLDVIRLLARRVATAHVLIVLSYRDEAVDASHPLRVLLGELASSVSVTRVAPAPLSRDAVARLADPYGVDADGLHALTGGNPFFVTEVLESGGEQMPATVRDAVLARAARLTPEARQVLDAVSVATPHAEWWLVNALAGETDSGVDECLGSGMLVAVDAGVAFRHELARLAIVESITAARRVNLHRTALRALVSRADSRRDLARIAHHADAAGDAEAVLEFARAAGVHASSVSAHREAAEQFARALRYSHGLPPDERAELLKLRSRESYLADQSEEAIAALRAAAACYRELGDPIREGDVLSRLGLILWCPGRGREGRIVAAEAVALLEQHPPGRELAGAYGVESFVLAAVPDADRATRAAQRSLELAETLGDADVLCEALLRIGRREVGDDRERGLATIDRAEALARKCGLEDVVADAYLTRAYVATDADDHDAARAAIEDGLTYCRTHGVDLIELYLLANLAVLELAVCRWPEAVETAMVVLGRREVSTFPRTLALSVLARVRARRGDPDVLPLLAEGQALAEPTGELWRLAPVAEAAAEAAWLRGDAAHAREATQAALDLAVSVGEAGVATCLQSWRRRAGVVEPRRGPAVGHYALELTGEPAAAAARWSERGRPYEAALALADVGDEQSLRGAHAALKELGARAPATVVAGRLRALGVRDIPRGPRPATRGNAAGLTARESEILALLAQGLRNAEIAQQLFLSTRTVGHHVSAILRKLHAETRGEAVAKAATLGLLSN